MVTDVIISTAQKYLGVVKGSDEHKRIIDLYNNARERDAYKMTYSDPWCAAFIVAVFEENGLAGFIPCYAACYQMINIFKKWNRFHSEKSYSPKRGDIVFYNWNSDSVSDHVGIVIHNNFGVLNVIEGNKDSSVGYRSISVSDPCIMGYGSPEYESMEPVESNSTDDSWFGKLSESDKKIIKTLPIIIKQSIITYIKILHAFLIFYKNLNFNVDGDFVEEIESELNTIKDK